MNDPNRAAFEAWARKQPRYPINDPDFDLDSDQKRYKNHTVQGDWETWQASRKAALEDAAQMCDRMQPIPASEPRHCAEDIRSMK